MANVTGKPDFRFYFLLINLKLKLNGPMWLLTSLLDSIALDLIISSRKYKGLKSIVYDTTGIQ